MIGNNASNDELHSISLSVSNNNTLIGNNASNSVYLSYSSNNTLTYNTGGIGLSSSNNNILTYNTGGIFLSSSNNNILSNNNASNNIYGIGISLDSSSNNTLSGNTALNNGYGVYLSYSSNNNLTSNNASNNTDGFYLSLSHYNELSSNTLDSNHNYGIYISSSIRNNISNNFFNNTNNTYTDTAPNNWNTTKTPGTNIIGDPYLGGNFWAYPNGTGFSKTCNDSDGDGICDSPYVLDANNIDYLPLAYKSVVTPTPTPTTTPTPTPTPTPLLVTSITPNSRNAQVGTPVTIFMSVINGGSATATKVSITQASSLPVNAQFRQWNGTAFIEALNTPVDIPAGGTANFVVGINATSAFNSSPMTFNVSSTNGAKAPISGVNTLTISASAAPIADVIIMSTSLAVSTSVNTPTVFALATVNVGGANASGVSLYCNIPASISGLTYQMNETYPVNGTIKGPATGLTIPVGAQPTFAVFITPTQPIAFDPANNRITLQLIDGSGKIIGAQSVAISTT